MPLGLDQARLSNLFQLSKTSWGRELLAEGRGVAEPPLAKAASKIAAKRPARPPTSSGTSTAWTSVPGYASSRLPGSGRIEETGGPDWDSHPYTLLHLLQHRRLRDRDLLPRAQLQQALLLQTVVMMMWQSFAKW